MVPFSKDPGLKEALRDFRDTTATSSRGCYFQSKKVDVAISQLAQEQIQHNSIFFISDQKLTSLEVSELTSLKGKYDDIATELSRLTKTPDISSVEELEGKIHTLFTQVNNFKNDHENLSKSNDFQEFNAHILSTQEKVETFAKFLHLLAAISQLTFQNPQSIDEVCAVINKLPQLAETLDQIRTELEMCPHAKKYQTDCVRNLMEKCSGFLYAANELITTDVEKKINNANQQVKNAVREFEQSKPDDKALFFAKLVIAHNSSQALYNDLEKKVNALLNAAESFKNIQEATVWQRLYMGIFDSNAAQDFLPLAKYSFDFLLTQMPQQIQAIDIDDKKIIDAVSVLDDKTQKEITTDASDALRTLANQKQYLTVDIVIAQARLLPIIALGSFLPNPPQQITELATQAQATLQSAATQVAFTPEEFLRQQLQMPATVEIRPFVEPHKIPKKLRKIQKAAETIEGKVQISHARALNSLYPNQEMPAGHVLQEDYLKIMQELRQTMTQFGQVINIDTYIKRIDALDQKLRAVVGEETESAAHAQAGWTLAVTKRSLEQMKAISQLKNVLDHSPVSLADQTLLLEMGVADFRISACQILVDQMVGIQEFYHKAKKMTVGNADCEKYVRQQMQRYLREKLRNLDELQVAIDDNKAFAMQEKLCLACFKSLKTCEPQQRTEKYLEFVQALAHLRRDGQDAMQAAQECKILLEKLADAIQQEEPIDVGVKDMFFEPQTPTHYYTMSTDLLKKIEARLEAIKYNQSFDDIEVLAAQLVVQDPSWMPEEYVERKVHVEDDIMTVHASLLPILAVDALVQQKRLTLTPDAQRGLDNAVKKIREFMTSHEVVDLELLQREEEVLRAMTRWDQTFESAQYSEDTKRLIRSIFFLLKASYKSQKVLRALQKFLLKK